MTEQAQNHAEIADDRRATTGDGTESDLERYGLGPEDDKAGDDASELLSGADATQERDSSLNRFGLGPEE